MIVESAVKVGDDVYTAPYGGGVCPHNGLSKTRHCCVYQNNSEVCERVKGGEPSTQGFITDTGEFLDRDAAAQHAFDCGQTPERETILFSEDLW